MYAGCSVIAHRSVVPETLQKVMTWKHFLQNVCMCTRAEAIFLKQLYTRPEFPQIDT